MTAKKRLLSILVAVLMVFAMMPMIGGVAYADDPVYTVTFVPGEGSGTQFTMSSKDAISYDDMLAGNYNEEKGCFFNTDWAMYYKLPTKCTFTAPSDNMEFGAWKINDDTYDLGDGMLVSGYFDDGSTSATITAIWKEVDPPWYEMVSVPEEINVNYCATRTTFDCQVKLAGKYNFYDSTFTCSENGQSIPFTVNGNEINNYSGRFIGGGGTSGYGYFIYSDTTLPYTVPIYIDISDSAWSVAKPGRYTANIEMRCTGEEGEIYIPLTLTVPDTSKSHTVTFVDEDGTTILQTGDWAEGSTPVYSGQTPTKPADEKNTYTFAGWSPAITTVTDDATYTATYTATPIPATTYTVTYEVVNGTWSDDKTEAITEQVEENQNPKNVPTGMKPAEGFEGGSWNTDPSTTSITGDTRFTYTFSKKQDPPVKIAVPTGKTLTYDGKSQTGVVSGTGYTLSGTTAATNAGTYTAKATLKEGYVWANGSSDVKSISWKINKAGNPLTIRAKTAKVKFAKLKKKAQPLAVGKLVTFKNKGQGTRTYKLVSAKKGKKSFKNKFAVNKKNGKLTVKKGLKKGTYKVKINVTAAGNGNFNKVTKPVTVTIKVN